MNKQSMFFRKDILSKTGILTKLRKNLVIIAGSLCDRWQLRNLYAKVHINMAPPPPSVCIHLHFDRHPYHPPPPTPLSENEKKKSWLLPHLETATD